jgi:preprotein translocase subunit SecB
MSDNPPSFQIEKIYVKDLSLEVPGAPQVFMQAESPRLEVQLASGGAQFGEGLYEVTVTVTVTARAGDKTVFLAEAAQAGIFALRGIPKEQIDPLLGVTCPNILFPYAREAISDLVARSGFPPVLLAPVNFEALYAQRAAQGPGAPRVDLAS